MSDQPNEQLTKEQVLSKIPPFSTGVLRVMELLSRDEVCLASVAKAVEADTALSAQVLRLANSALFGSPSRIDTVQKSVVTVGCSWVQHLTLTVGVSHYVNSAFQTDELRNSWRHTLATATLCRELARAAGLSCDRAYTAGLLHDIGRLGLLAAFPTEYARLLKEAIHDAAPLLDREQATFGIDHCELGRYLLEEWNLPTEFRAISSRHHEASSDEPFAMLTVVRLACGLADALGFHVMPPARPTSLEEVRQALPESAQSRFPDTLEKLLEIVEAAVGEKGAVQSVAIPQPQLVEEEPAPAPAPHIPEPIHPAHAQERTSGVRFDRRLGVILAVLGGLAFFLVLVTRSHF